MFEQRRIDIIFEALQPIAHHEGTLGNHATIMTREVRREGGGWAKVAQITGDSMRHQMRYGSSLAVLRAADMLGEHLSEGALRLLFAGGMVTGRGDASTINLDRYRELCELVPPLALFGGCSDSRVIPGKLFVEPATLICHETERYLPEWARAWLRGEEADGRAAETLDDARRHIEVVQRVRMDPALRPDLRTLLTPEAQVGTVAKLTAGEARHEADDVAVARDKSTMMPRTFEVVKQGSLFHWTCLVNLHSPLEEDTFFTTIGALISVLDSEGIGGKRGTGHGRLRPVVARNITIARAVESPEPFDAMTIARRTGDLFRAHVAERKERIKSFFREVNA